MKPFQILYLLQLYRILSRNSTSMALKPSCSRKTMESPFSHVEKYGCEHPASSRVRQNGKATSKGGKDSGKMVKSTTVRSASSVPSSRFVSDRSTVSSASTSSSKHKKKGSAKVSLKTSFPSKNGIIRNGNETEIRITSASATLDMCTCVVKVDHDLSILRKQGQTSINGTWAHSKNGVASSIGKKSSICSSEISESPSSSSTVPKKSLLARSTSTMSTSEVLRRFNKDSGKSGSTDCSANVRLNRTVKNVKVSPLNMRLPRRAFNTVSKDGKGQGSPANSRAKIKSGGPLTVNDIGMGLGKMQYRNVIVMSGAGISTASGIPDFRTPGTGLYDNLQQYKIPDPTAIFDISFFVHNPKPFFTLARELYPGRYQPNAVHYFVRLLQERGVLLRNYTQNIDGLERLAGVSSGKLVEAHGSFSTASCINCKTKQDPEQVKALIFNGRTPRCKHKYCYGLVKPDIVFFGEDLPGRFHSLQLPDFAKCDLLIIMGTSLEVEPFASLVSLAHLNVPRLLINREVVGPFRHRRKRSTDVAMTGDLVECVSQLADIAGWTKELDTLVKGVQSDPSADSLAPPSTDLQLQSLSSSSATSPTNHDRLNRDNPAQVEEELCSSLAQLNLQDGYKETDVTKRHDCAEKREGLREPSVDRGERNGVTEFHHHEEKRKINGYCKGKRDEATLEEKEEQRTDQYSADSSGDLKGERTSDKLAGILEEEEEESGNEVLEWRISDVFNGLNNDSVTPKNHS